MQRDLADGTDSQSEAMGAGLRGLIVASLGAEIPLVIGVPLVNLDVWQAFVDGFEGEAMHDLGQQDDVKIPEFLAAGPGLVRGEGSLGHETPTL